MVIREVRDDLAGNLLAMWFLWTNVPPTIPAATIALWYYWRWRIETYFKLLKSADLQLEDWKQQTADTVARRLLVAGMACVVCGSWPVTRHLKPTSAALAGTFKTVPPLARGTSFTMPWQRTTEVIRCASWYLLVPLRQQPKALPISRAYANEMLEPEPALAEPSGTHGTASLITWFVIRWLAFASAIPCRWT